MQENCRVCCETTQGINAKNLFESKQIILLHHIELLTGEWLTNEKNAPTFICNRCEQDLKVSAALRERCIKTQRILRNIDMNVSPTLETIDEIKLEGSLVDENEYLENDQCTESDQYVEYALDCTGEGELYDIKDCVIDDEDFDEDFDNLIFTSPNRKEEEIQPIEDVNEMEAQLVDSTVKTNPEPTVKIRTLVKQRINHCRFSRKKSMRRTHCICDQCGKHFTDPSNLKQHLIIHTGVKNYECEVCKNKFYTAHLLKRHSIKHTSTPPTYACKYCGKTYIYNNYRLRHEREHFKERRFHCDYCDKLFFSKAQQRNHELVHTQIRKHYCELCDQHFLRRTHLTTHYRSKTHKNNEQQRK